MSIFCIQGQRFSLTCIVEDTHEKFMSVLPRKEKACGFSSVSAIYWHAACLDKGENDGEGQTSPFHG